jgi:hypothetical protein
LLLGCWKKVKFKKKKNCKPTRRNNYNIDKFSEKRICEEYKSKKDNILKRKQSANESVNETWEHIKVIVNDVSMRVIGRTKSTSKPWFNKLCKEAIKRRKLVRQKWLEDINNN